MAEKRGSKTDSHEIDKQNFFALGTGEYFQCLVHDFSLVFN